MEEDKILTAENKVLRQNKLNRFIHWGIALSTFLLIFSGLGQMPIYKRYNVDKIIYWASNYDITLWLHYIGAIVLGFTLMLHIVYHGIMRKQFDIWPKKGDFKESYLIIRSMLMNGDEPPSDKYLAEQRLAYAFIGFSLILIFVTGLIKTYKNFTGLTIWVPLHYWSTMLHNVATVLVVFGVLAHLAAFIIPDNRALLPAMFTGKVNLKYAEHRHSKWIERLKKLGKQK